VRANERPETVVPASLAAPSSEAFSEAVHHAHLPAMGLSLAVASIGILLAFAVYTWRKIDADRVAVAMGPIHRFLVNKWYFDELYGALVIGGTLAWSSVLRWFDNTIVDGLVNASAWVTRGISFVSGKFDSVVVDGLVNLTAYLSGFAGLVLRKFQTGRIQTYLIFVVMSVMLLYFIFRVV
jgi:NADH-quinone oxidoreductase subunit L